MPRFDFDYGVRGRVPRSRQRPVLKLGANRGRRTISTSRLLPPPNRTAMNPANSIRPRRETSRVTDPKVRCRRSTAEAFTGGLFVMSFPLLPAGF